MQNLTNNLDVTNLKVCSGGQTGADLGGLIAAKQAGLETFGWMPPGFLTEFGPKPH